ncbi:hypothetical protein [Rhizobium leguminosarum]|uniref:hypothetical protein n=1 Tax=Rhizobium leguminosarum TaxID=384 RepID=UPI001FDFAA14|nr:hypothetical protein [Rhizobium leguminosarum]
MVFELGILERMGLEGATVNRPPFSAVAGTMPGIEQGQVVVKIPVAGGIVGVDASTAASDPEGR